MRPSSLPTRSRRRRDRLNDSKVFGKLLKMEDKAEADMFDPNNKVLKELEVKDEAELITNSSNTCEERTSKVLLFAENKIKDKPPPPMEVEYKDAIKEMARELTNAERKTEKL